MSTFAGTSSWSSASSSTTPGPPPRPRRAQRRRSWQASPAESRAYPLPSRFHAHRGSRVVHGAGLSAGVTWRALVSGDRDSKLEVGRGLRRCPPSDVLAAWSESCRVVGAAHPPGGWSRSTRILSVAGNHGVAERKRLYLDDLNHLRKGAYQARCTPGGGEVECV